MRLILEVLWYFADGLRAYNWILVKITFASILILLIHSGHNFAHVTTAQLLWHVQNYDLIRSLFFMQEQHIFLDYELFKQFVKWVSDISAFAWRQGNECSGWTMKQFHRVLVWKWCEDWSCFCCVQACINYWINHIFCMEEFSFVVHWFV